MHLFFIYRKRTPLGDCISLGGHLSMSFHFRILRSLFDAGWLVRLVLLATGPAYIIHGIQNLFGNVTVVLGCRLATYIGTRAHDRLLETVAELLAELLVSYSHRQAAILGYQIMSHTIGLIHFNNTQIQANEN